MSSLFHGYPVDRVEPKVLLPNLHNRLLSILTLHFLRNSLQARHLGHLLSGQSMDSVSLCSIAGNDVVLLHRAVSLVLAATV